MIFGRPPVEHDIITPDQLRIAVRSWPGNGSQKPAIVLVHGYSQSHLCWMKLVTAALVQPFDLVAYDLRGHGDSEKPEEVHFYRESARWADELAAVIAATCTCPPVVVAWSYGGRVLFDYVSRYGSAGLAGVVLVSATSNGQTRSFGPGAAGLAAMHQPRLDRNVASVLSLWTDCIKAPLDDEVRLAMVASNMMTPPWVRANMSGRPADYEAACRAIDCPTLVIHGDLDPINTLEMARYSAAMIAGSQLAVYEDTGHAPFLERPDRFARDLVAFVGRCS